MPIGGGFTSINGAARTILARLNAGGSLDASFQNGFAGVNGTIGSIMVQGDGKLLVGGGFSSINGISVANIARFLGMIPSLRNFADGSGGLFLRFTGAPDVTYRLQRAASVPGTRSDLATNTAPAFRLRGAPKRRFGATAAGLIEFHAASPPPGPTFFRTVQP